LFGGLDAESSLVFSGAPAMTANNFVDILDLYISKGYSKIELKVTGDSGKQLTYYAPISDGYRSHPWQRVIAGSGGEDKDYVQVRVAFSDKSLAVDGQSCQRQDLAQKLNEIARKSGKRLVLVFEPAPNVKYEDFVSIIKDCQIASFAGFNIKRFQLTR
jgi:biopolymer transport protein ExbD